MNRAKMLHHSDRELVAFALEGNQFAFSQLMLRHRESLCSYIQHQFLLGDSAEDLLLVIFEKAFRKLERYDPSFAFSTWLYAIADNTCIDHVRKKRDSRHEVHYSEVIATASDPESELIALQEAAMLIRNINRLKPIYREPVRLRYLYNYAYAEIASELSLPVNTVKVRLRRAKEILNKWIAQS